MLWFTVIAVVVMAWTVLRIFAAERAIETAKMHAEHHREVAATRKSGRGRRS